MIAHIIVGLIHVLKMTQYFRKTYGTPDKNIKVELYLYNFEVDLISFRPDVDKSHIDKLKTIPKN